MSDLLTGEPGATTQTTVDPNAGGAVTIPEGMEWLKGVEPTLLNEPSVKNIKDLNSLVKSFVHSQKMIGQDKVVIPKKGAAPEQWQEVFTKLGLPKKEEYKLDKAEKSALGARFYEKATELGHAQGILPHQMQSFVNELEKDALAVHNAQQEQAKLASEKAVTDLKKEWGDAFEAKLHNSREVVNKFGDDSIKQFIQESGLGGNTTFVKFLEKIGSSLSEAKIIEGKDSAGSPMDLQSELDSILKDNNHPYWKKDHVGHAAASQRVSELFAKLS